MINLKKNSKKNSKKKAFTLIEILIVIAIISILIAVLTPKIITHTNEARTSGVVANGQSILSIVESSIAKNVTTKLVTADLTKEIDKLGLVNPITKGGIAYSVGTVPASNPIKGCVYVEITKGDATSIEGVTLHRVDAYGDVIKPLVKGGQQ